MKGMSEGRGRWQSALLLAALILAAWLTTAGCGGGGGMTQEEALESIGSAYRTMAGCSGYRYRSEVTYDFPDMDEETKDKVVGPSSSQLSMEGEVQQGEGGYRQHAWNSGKSAKLEVYVVEGFSYRFTESTGWVYTDLSTFSLNISDLYSFSPEDFEKMMGFVTEVEIVEETPEKLIVSFDAGSDYLLSSLEKSREKYEEKDQLVVYDMLHGIMSNSSTVITSHIYKNNGYLERQEIAMRLPDTPWLGTVVMNFTSDFFNYGAAINIQLPEEAYSAMPADPI